MLFSLFNVKFILGDLFNNVYFKQLMIFNQRQLFL